MRNTIAEELHLRVNCLASSGLAMSTSNLLSARGVQVNRYYQLLVFGTGETYLAGLRLQRRHVHTCPDFVGRCIMV